MRFGKSLLLAVPALAAAAAPVLVAPGEAADPAPAPRARFSLCAADETILFQCRSGMKLVSVCGHRSPTPGARFLYGNPGHIDYGPPADAAISWRRVGAGRLEIHVRDGAHEHIVYYGGPGSSFAADGRMDSYSVDGVWMDQGGTALVDRRCAGEASRNGRIQDFMPEDETPQG